MRLRSLTDIVVSACALPLTLDSMSCDIPAAIPNVTAETLADWIDPSWTPETPGMTDQTVGIYLSDDILAPLFNDPAPTIP